MATSLFGFRVTTPAAPPVFTSGDQRSSVKRLIAWLTALNNGTLYAPGTTTLVTNDTEVQATGSVTFASSSGTVGAIINGVTVTVTWATSDTVSAALLAAAINASVNALVTGHVTATSALGVTTVTAVRPGPAGNTITLALSGTNVTVSGARLTGGTATSLSTTW